MRFRRATGIARSAENSEAMAEQRVEKERMRLSRLAPDFSSEEGFNARLIDFRFDAMRPFLEGRGSCVELGSADGRMTERLATLFDDLSAVDGTEAYVQEVARRLPQVEAVHSLFEEYEPGRRFHAAVLGHVLEHVDDPVAILGVARDLLEPGGVAIVTVPNADSIHRHVGVAMGMLAATTELNEADHRIGHRRVYTREALMADVRAAGLTVDHVGGVFLKPLSNGQIEEQWSEQQVQAFYEVGKLYPGLCAELMVVAGAA
jgi:2-polyprenyl-3-methyl-5-hydroxy-6-metoxy-1,4-benzoquinol methylase